MHRYALVCICLLFAASAQAQGLGEKSGINSVLGVSPSTQDFVTEAAMGDMLEIESGKLAQQQSSDPMIKQFANQLVTDHQKTTDELKTLVESGKVKAKLPTAMDSSHQGKLDKLKAAKGADFGKMFEDTQRSVHKDATSLFERYAKGGENSDLKAFASKNLPTLQHHLQMAEDLQGKTSTQGRGNR